MKITTNNTSVPTNTKSTKCKVPKATLLFKPADVNKYKGSLAKHYGTGIGISMIGGTVNVIDVETDIKNTKWCLINHNGYYYYTPAEFIDLSNFNTVIDEPKIMTMSLNAENGISTQAINTGEVYVPDYILDKMGFDSSKWGGSGTVSVDLNGKYPYTRTSLFNTPQTAKAIVVVNRDHFKSMVGQFSESDVREYPSYMAKGLDMNYVYEKVKNNVFIPIQSIWKDNISGMKYYGTTYFAQPGEYTASYIPSKAIGSGGFHKNVEETYTQYYAMCFYEKVIPGYRLGDGTSPGGFTHHDMFSANFTAYESDGEHFYQICAYDKGVVAVRPTSFNGFSPFAHSSDWFVGDYLGRIQNVDSDASCRIINTATFWSDKNNTRYERLRASDLSFWCDSTKRPISSIDFKFSPLRDKSLVKSGSELITYNKYTFNGTQYWIAALSSESYRHLWFIVEAKDDLDWVKIVNGYKRDDEPTIDESIPRSSDFTNTDIISNWSESAGVEAKGGVESTKEAQDSIDKRSAEENKNKYIEPWYETTLDPGNSSFKVPGIIEGVDDKFINVTEMWNEGVNDLHDAVEYENQEVAPLYTWNDSKHITKINRFKLMPTNSGLATKSFIFMTRPDLHLFDEDESTGVISGNMNPDLKRLPTFKYIAHLQNSCQRIMGSLQYSTRTADRITPWLSIISNQATGYSPVNREMDVTEIGETFHGNKIVYVEPTFRHKIAGTVTIPFRERRDLSLYYTLKMWIEYMQAVTLGRCSPRRKYIVDMILDYAVSLYFIQTDETMENILYWEKLVGVIPLTVPDDFFEWDEKNHSKNMEYSINFAYSFRVVQDEMSLCEINNLYSLKDRRTGGLAYYDGYDSSYDATYNNLIARVADSFGTISQNSAGSPFDHVNEVPNIAANKELMRKYYYANKPTFGVSNPGSNGYKIKVQDSNGNISYQNAQFLPNYIPDIGMHGIPYVTGPFITRELDRMAQSEFHGGNGTYTGNPIDNGQYKLRWI